MLASLLPLADLADEGRDIITGMLIVGAVFIGVIAVGQLTHWLRHRRQ